MPIRIAIAPFIFVALAGASMERSTTDGRTLSSLFEEKTTVEVTASGMTVVHGPQHHVLVVRLADDGSMESGCAVTRDAVEALLKKPATRASQEQ